MLPSVMCHAPVAETKAPFQPQSQIRSPKVDRVSKRVMAVAVVLFLLMIAQDQPMTLVAAVSSLTPFIVTGGQTAYVARRGMFAEDLVESTAVRAPSRQLLGSSLGCIDGSSPIYIDQTGSTRSSGTTAGEHATISVGTEALVAYARDNGRIYVNVGGTTRDFSGAPSVNDFFRNPQMARATDGQIGVVFSGYDGSFYFGIINEAGQTVRAPSLVSDESGVYTHPLIISRLSGGWFISQVSANKVTVRSFDSTGTLVDSYSASLPSISSTPPRRTAVFELGNGNVGILYEDTPASPNLLLGRLLSPTLTLIDGSFLSLTGSFPVSQRLTNDNTLLVYLNSSGQPTWRILGSDGATVVADTLLCSSTPSTVATHLDLASAGDGTVALSFTAQDGDQNGVFTQLFNPDGSPRGTEFLAHPSNAGDQNFGRAAFVSDGSMRIAYNQGSSVLESTGFVNTPPTPVAAGTLQVYPNEQKAFPLNATDPDPWETGLNLTADPLEPWMSLIGAPGSYALSVNPPGSSQGRYPLSLSWTDRAGATVVDNAEVFVASYPPTIASTAPTTITVNAGQSSSFNVGAIFGADPDGDPYAVTLTRADGSPLPPFASYNATTRIAKFSPLSGDQSTIPLRARADDGFEGGVADHNISLIVPNRAPAIAATASDLIINIGELFVQNIATFFQELDGDSVTYTLDRADGGAIQPPIFYDAASGEISVDAKSGDQGQTRLRARATDSFGATTSHIFQVIIANRIPVWSEDPADLNLTVGVPFTSALPPVTDPDGDPVSFSATGLPEGLSINPATGARSGTPSAPGTTQATIEAKDPFGGIAPRVQRIYVGEAATTTQPSSGSSDWELIGTILGIISASLAATYNLIRHRHKIRRICGQIRSGAICRSAYGGCVSSCRRIGRCLCCKKETETSPAVSERSLERPQSPSGMEVSFPREGSSPTIEDLELQETVEIAPPPPPPPPEEV